MQRPECFDFAMDFLGEPEASEIKTYVEELEAEREALAIKTHIEEMVTEREAHEVENADGKRRAGKPD